MSIRIVPWETLRIATRDMDLAQAIAQTILIGHRTELTCVRMARFSRKASRACTRLALGMSSYYKPKKSLVMRELRSADVRYGN